MDTNTTNTTDPAGQAPNGTDPTSQALTSDGQAPHETPNPSTEDLLRQIRELRAENATHRRKAKEQEQAAQAAEQQRMQEQGQYRELAEQHAARVKELEPIAERYGRLSDLVAEQIKDEIKDWPATVKALDPGSNAPIETRLEWRNKARAIVADLHTQARSTLPGNSPSPRPQAATREDAVAAFTKQLRQSGKYGA